MSRELVSELLAHLDEKGEIGRVVERDLASNEVELITANHVGAYYTPASDRSAAQHAQLEQSDALVAELKEADTLVIGSPMYNFSAPASLKAWIDLICRVGETFQYTEQGPQGLLNIETAYLVVATGGTPVGGEADFLVPYLKQIATFIGVKQVQVVAADKLQVDREQALDHARQQIAAL